MGLWSQLRHWARHAPRFHVRQSEAESLREAIEIVDRFLNGDSLYVLEWDDFIDWPHPNPSIERLRDEIATLEPEYFAHDQATKDEAVRKTIRIRDRHAALIAMSSLNECDDIVAAFWKSDRQRLGETDL